MLKEAYGEEVTLRARFYEWFKWFSEANNEVEFAVELDVRKQQNRM
jgi:hypothetical protein